MAGHNKWSKIKHRKAVVDKRRGKAWSMCSRAIISAARQHGPDPAFNFALRQALDDAKYHNVPSDNIERAIKKGAGGGEADNYEPVRYEGYGPGGIAVVVDALTNNRARTAGDLRLILGDHGGKLGTTGCVSHQFEQKGRIALTGAAADEDAILEAALAAGADDVKRGEDLPGTDDETPAKASWDVLCDPTKLHTVKQGLNTAKMNVGEAILDMIPTTTVAVAGEQAKDLLELIDALEDNDDVKKVYSNADIPENELAGME